MWKPFKCVGTYENPERKFQRWHRPFIDFYCDKCGKVMNGREETLELSCTDCFGLWGSGNKEPYMSVRQYDRSDMAFMPVGGYDFTGDRSRVKFIDGTVLENDLKNQTQFKKENGLEISNENEK